MGNIFVSRPGRVAVIPGQGTLPGSVMINNQGTISTSRVIITGLGYDQMAHVQFQQTLLNAIYLYSFGDKMGSIQVSGICFADTCKDPSDGGDGGSGIEDLLQFYADNRVSKANQSIRVTIGSKSITGYLVGATVRSLSTEHMTYNFMLTIAALPAYLDNG